MQQFPIQREVKDTTKSQGGGHGGGNNLQLKGMSYKQGAKALAPVQKKPFEGMSEAEIASFEYHNGSADSKKKQHAKNSGQKNLNYHESLLNYGNGQGKVEDTHGKYDAGTSTTLADLWDMVAVLATASVPEGAAHFAEVSAKLDLHFVQVDSKFTLEITDKSHGKVGIKGQVDFGTSVEVGIPGFEIFAPKIKGTLGGKYAVAATGDSASECFRLMQIGMLMAMKADANVLVQADEEQRDAAKKRGATKGGSWLLGALSWAWHTGAKIIKGVMNPEDTAEYCLSGLVDTMWNGDGGKGYDERIALAMAEMDDGDGVSVTRTKKAAGGLEIGDEERAGLSGEFAHETEQVTTLNKETGAAGHTGDKEKKKAIKVEGTLNLSELAGLKGKAEYERKWDAHGKAEGELKVEIEGGVSNWGGIGAAIGATIFSKVFEWIGEKKQNDGGLDGFGKAVFVSSMENVLVGVEKQSADMAHKATEVADKAKEAAHGHTTSGGSHASGGHEGHSHPVELGLELKWIHSPWKYEGCELKVIKPIFEKGLLGQKVGAKVGTKYAFEQQHGAHGGSGHT